MLAAKLLFLLLGAAADGSMPAAVLEASPLEPGCRRRLGVVGFSDNERAVAVSQTVTCPVAQGVADVYALIDLIDIKSHTVVATYQGSPVHRTAHNKPEFVPPATLRARHPHWARALPQHHWTKVRRAGHFGLKSHDFKDVMVRVRLDPDSPMDVRVEHGELVVTAPPQVPVGFTAVGRLVDGSEMDLGHVRDDTVSPNTDRGRLKMVFSAHGHALAVLHHGLRADTLFVSHTPNTQPIASTQVGFLQMLKWDADSVEKLFGEIHPEGKDIWEEMIGAIE